MTWIPTQDDSPYHRIGDEPAVRALVTRFYDHVDADEPSLARLHEHDEQGHVSAAARERFALFLVEWLGGPMVYSPTHGHPRLRMRHARLPIDAAMQQAWLRCMGRAMDDVGVDGELREFLDARFAEIAGNLRNVAG
jgi:hemoglobin